MLNWVPITFIWRQNWVMIRLGREGSQKNFHVLLWSIRTAGGFFVCWLRLIQNIKSTVKDWMRLRSSLWSISLTAYGSIFRHSVVLKRRAHLLKNSDSLKYRFCFLAWNINWWRRNLHYIQQTWQVRWRILINICIMYLWSVMRCMMKRWYWLLSVHCL